MPQITQPQSPERILALLVALFMTPITCAANFVFVTASSVEFNQPHDLALDNSGTYLYVADMNNDSVKVLDPQNLKVLGEFGNGELSSPHDVEFDAEGRLIVADSGNHRLVIYTLNGLVASKTTVLTNEMRSPEGVAASQNGDLYIANTGGHDVVHFRGATENKAFNKTGKAGRGENEFIRPHDLEIWGERLYVTDPGNNRIKILTLDFHIEQILGGSPYDFNEPKYLALDEQGWLYVADQYNNRIQVFAAYPSHHELLASISTYSIDGKKYILNKPEGVEVHGKYIWIADTYHNRILLYKRSD